MPKPSVDPVVPTDAGNEYDRWNQEIVFANKQTEKFHKRADSVVKKFLDERETTVSDARWFNLFYANTQILESSLYAQLPKPDVSRKYIDYNDDVARVAALIVERCITQDLDDPRDNFDTMMRQVVQDRLVPGLAQAWLRLVTETEPIPLIELTPTAGGTEIEHNEPLERIVNQNVVVDYVFWKDFVWSPCRVWSERRWVGRAVYMTRPELVKRFGEEHGNAIPLMAKSSINTNDSTPKELMLSCAKIYEIWDRVSRKVLWLCMEYKAILDSKDDPLKLQGFEPCPTPMLANTSTSNTTPRPDYFMLQDQYMELDSVNNRISRLVQACKVVGVYDQSQKAIAGMLNDAVDNQLVPVENWPQFSEKSGLKGTIDWLPLDQVVTTLRELIAARDAIKGQIYELTGIADIVRGASKASETLGAQKIKAQFASIRIKKLQDEVARFASEVMRIKAEIMVKHFAPELLVQLSGVMQTDNKEYVGPAIELLKSDTGFEWRISISADTLAQADYAMEKSDRMAFLQALSAYLQQAGSMVVAVPDAAPVLIGILKWAIAGFRNARDIEGMLDKALDAIGKAPKENKGPSPEEMKMQGEMQMMQVELETFKQKAAIEMQKLSSEAQAAEHKNQLELQLKTMEIKLETQRLQMEAQRLQMEQTAEERKLELESIQQNMELQFTKLMNDIKIEAAKEMAGIKAENASAPATSK